MSIYEEIEIEDMTYDPDDFSYTYPCPCGDKFRITLEELWDGEDIAKCPSCTLRIMVIFEEEDLPELLHALHQGSDVRSMTMDSPLERMRSTTAITTLLLARLPRILTLIIGALHRKLPPIPSDDIGCEERRAQRRTREESATLHS